MTPVALRFDIIQRYTPLNVFKRIDVRGDIHCGVGGAAPEPDFYCLIRLILCFLCPIISYLSKMHIGDIVAALDRCSLRWGAKRPVAVVITLTAGLLTIKI